jgi:hypothetical protein
MGVNNMLCTITKWFISRSLDTNKEMPVLFRRHLRRCASCREFQRAALQIQSRSLQDAGKLINNTPEGLSGRIKAHVFQPDDSLQESYKPLKYRSRWLVPAASTAAAVLLAVFLIIQPFQNQTQTPDNKELSIFNSLTRPAEKVKNVSLEVESPYERELETLQKAVHSASRHILNKLDLRIGS